MDRGGYYSPESPYLSDRLKNRYGGFVPLGELKATPSTGEKALDVATAPAKAAVHAAGELGTLPVRLREDADTYAQTGQYNPATAVEAAMLTWGAGALGGAPQIGKEAVLGAGPVRVWHASPHEFEKFDLSRLGTGQGQHMFSPGAYTAEARAVAEDYIPEFTRKAPFKYEGVPVSRESGGDLSYALSWLEGQRPKAGESVAQFLERRAAELQQHGRFAESTYGGGTSHMYDIGAKSLRNLDPAKLELPKASLYELNMLADPERMLHWQFPLDQQPAFVQDAMVRALKKRGVDAREIDRLVPSSGEDAYKALANNQPNLAGGWRVDPHGATRDMLREGVPGVQYRDAFSRGVADPKFVEQEINRLNAKIVDLQASPAASRHADMAQAQKDLAGYEAQMVDLKANPPTHNFVNYDASDLQMLRKVFGIGAVPAAGAAASVVREDKT